MRKIMLAQSTKAYYRNATIGSERILALCMKTSTSVVKVLSVYAPNLTSSPGVKDQFYDGLEESVL